MVEEFSLGFVSWDFGNFDWTQNLIGNSIYMLLLVTIFVLYYKNPTKNFWLGLSGVMWILSNSFIHISATMLSGEYAPNTNVIFCNGNFYFIDT